MTFRSTVANYNATFMNQIVLQLSRTEIVTVEIVQSSSRIMSKDSHVSFVRHYLFEILLDHRLVGFLCVMSHLTAFRHTHLTVQFEINQQKNEEIWDDLDFERTCFVHFPSCPVARGSLLSADLSLFRQEPC